MSGTNPPPPDQAAPTEAGSSAQPAVGGTTRDKANAAATNVPGGVTYNAWIIDTDPSHHHPSWAATTQDQTAAQLVDYLSKLAVKAGYTGDPKATVTWVTAFPSGIKDHEMVVYLRPFASSRHAAPALAKAAGKTGCTAWVGDGMYTEVWMERIDKIASADKLYQTLANVIMHEWMHQKMDAHPSEQPPAKDPGADIHASCIGNSIGVETVDSTNSVNDQDVTDIGPKLNNQYKQKKY